MNQNPTEEDITEAILDTVGQPSARFVYAEGSEERGEGQDDSTGFTRMITEAEKTPEYHEAMAEHAKDWNRNPELDRIMEEIADWPRQNLEIIHHRE